MTKPLSLWWLLPFSFSFFFFASFVPSISGDVIINEMSAASSEKLLRTLPDGRLRVGWGPGWMDPEFDDSRWEIGTAPFGFGNDDIATDLGETMIQRTPSLYLRKTFTVSAENAAVEEAFRLSAEADSGFVAFINGHEIARANLGRMNGFVYHDQSAFSSAQRNQRITYNSVVLASDILQAGENVFAVQVQNTVPSQINERDQSIDTTLRFDATSLAIGLGIFAGGSNIPIELSDEDWKYQIGYIEPSGGFADLRHAANPDVDADFSDWIELYNNGAEEVDLSGWHLTDDISEPDKWAFPEGTTIAADGYLIVMADGMVDVEGDYLHASFALSASGEDLALFDADGNLVSEISGGFPEQGSFHTFGLGSDASGSYVYFEEPTPGGPNRGPELGGYVAKPDFEPQGAIYDEAVSLTLTTDTEDAVIRYTTDGSEPSEFNGMIYDGPITINPIDEKTGTSVRARAFKEGLIPSLDHTQTYLVGVHDVFKDVPIVSMVGDANQTFYAPHGIMTVEGGTGIGEDWRAVNATDYYMPDMHGRSFERRISLEFLSPGDDGTNVQMHGGVRLAASAWSRGRFTLRATDRSPWTSSPAEKPSFNLFFRNDYGDETLDHPLIPNYPVRSFAQFRMRAGKNDITNPWITDELSRRVLMDTGQFGSAGIQNALFVNGVFKGYYNTVARLREELFQEYYGSNEPWQVKHIDVWADGGDDTNQLADPPEFKHLEALLEEDLTVLENYEAVLEVLDPVNFADYFIVNIYGATWDWPHNNLVLARELSPEGKWRAYMWDAEGMFGISGGHALTYNTITSDLKNRSGTTPSDDLATIWNGLMVSPEFRLLFADRLQKHFFTPGGALSKANLLRRLEEVKNEIAPLMQFSGGGAIRTSGFESWINGREAVLFTSGKHFQNEKLWGDAQTPFSKPDAREIEPGTTVTLDVGTLFTPQNGNIFFTTDGSDPRLPGGLPTPDAILYERDGPGLVFEDTTVLKARVHVTTIFDPIGKWSALHEATYRVGVTPATSENFVISEMMIDPANPSDREEEAGFESSDFEFIEFYNPTETAIDLSDLRFTSGIDYQFAQGNAATLGPRSFGVIVSDIEAFKMRYGGSLPILGTFDRKLDNAGELIEISNGDHEAIKALTYSPDEPWPTGETRQGFSLVLTDPNANPNPDDPANWELGSIAGGTPGRAEDGELPDPSGNEFGAWKAIHFNSDELLNEQISGSMADPDGDGDTNFAEFAFGADPNDPHSTVAMEAKFTTLEVDGEMGDYVTLSFTQRNPPTDLIYTLEHGSDLKTWEPMDEADLVEIDSMPLADGLKRVTLRLPENASSFVRWHVTVKD